MSISHIAFAPIVTLQDEKLTDIEIPSFSVISSYIENSKKNASGPRFRKVMNELAKRLYDANYIISELEQLQSDPLRIMLLESKMQKTLDKEAGLRRSMILRIYDFRISSNND